VSKKIERAPWVLDESTGIPLSLFPTLEAPDVYNRNGELYHTDPDEHHIYHSRSEYSPEKLGEAGPVVRGSRLQTVRRYHHEKAHELLAPPPIIIDPKEQLLAGSLAIMKYIPRKVIDIRNDKPETTELNDTEYELLKSLTHNSYLENFYSTIGRFFIRTMTREYQDSIDDDLRCQLLEAKHNATIKSSPRNIKNFRLISHQILNVVTEEAVGPINPHYTELKSSGEIPFDQITPFEAIQQFTKKVSKPTRILVKELAA
jgi:hypothetical protein